MQIVQKCFLLDYLLSGASDFQGGPGAECQKGIVSKRKRISVRKSPVEKDVFRQFQAQISDHLKGSKYPDHGLQVHTQQSHQKRILAKDE